ncbi:MAG: hypothetical protein K0S14_1158 [Thermomicrobiales bacterium]|nr:hypothetical protein [Thermomicrobiales bacterium]
MTIPYWGQGPIKKTAPMPKELSVKQRAGKIGKTLDSRCTDPLDVPCRTEILPRPEFSAVHLPAAPLVVS